MPLGPCTLPPLEVPTWLKYLPGNSLGYSSLASLPPLLCFPRSGLSLISLLQLRPGWTKLGVRSQFPVCNAALGSRVLDTDLFGDKGKLNWQTYSDDQTFEVLSKIPIYSSIIGSKRERCFLLSTICNFLNRPFVLIRSPSFSSICRNRFALKWLCWTCALCHLFV